MGLHSLERLIVLDFHETIEHTHVIQPSSAYEEFASSCLPKENGLGKTADPGNPQRDGYSSEKCAISFICPNIQISNPWEPCQQAAIFTAVEQ